MEHYQITITGKQPLLMHADDINWSDQMDAWKNDKDNKKMSKAGDDRSPAWRWLGHLYHDGHRIVMPVANIMRCLMEGGVMVPVPGGKSGKTFKAQTQSGILAMEPNWPIFVGPKLDQEIPVGKILQLTLQKEFEIHQQAVKDHGFELYLKRAKIGSSKHVRVRPRFQKWAIQGVLVVIDEQITQDVLADFFEMAGKYKGLGDWRPSSPRAPGPNGTFEAKIERLN